MTSTDPKLWALWWTWTDRTSPVVVCVYVNVGGSAHLHLSVCAQWLVVFVPVKQIHVVRCDATQMSFGVRAAHQHIQ